MKTRAQIEQDLGDLIASGYYSEDFELVSVVRGYRDQLSLLEREDLGVIVLQRLLRDGSIVDILLCSVVDVPSAAPVLAAKLDREEAPSQTTRALIRALQGYRGDDVFHAVERFVDSQQEHEAVQALALIDFVRATPYLLRALRHDHQLDLCLHILHERRKRIGLSALGEELRGLADRGAPDLAGRVALALRAKADPYNPFTEDDVQRLLAALHGPQPT